jgi:CBS domain-containing protein
MKIFGDVRAVLNNKGSQVWSISPDTIVYDAIEFLAEKNVGALPVIDGEKLVGMFSERDYTRKVILKGKSSKESTVREIMFSPVTAVTPEHTVEECLRIMTDKRIRHLPVVQGDKVLGLISIGDLVNWTISAQNATIDHLENYIAGHYPG